MHTRIWGIAVLSCLVISTWVSAQTPVRTLSAVQNGGTLDTPPRIAVGPDGASIVVWGEQWQYIHPDGSLGTLVREEVPLSAVYALDNGGWAFLHRADSSWDASGYIYGQSVYRLQLRDPFQVLGQSDTLLRLLSASSLTDDPSEGWNLQYLHAAERDGQFLFSATLRNTIVQYPGPGADRQEHRAWLWRPGGSFTLFDPGAPTRHTGCSFNSMRGDFSESGIPFLLRHDQIDWTGQKQAFRRIRLDPVSGQAVSQDTLSSFWTPLMTCPHFIAGLTAHDDGALDIIEMDLSPPKDDLDSLIVRHYDAAGEETGWDMLCKGIHMLPNPDASAFMPDVAHLPVEGGKHLLCWARQETPDVCRIYLSAFDQDWQPIGEPRSVAEGAGIQIAAAIARLGQDSIAVAWYEKNTGWEIKYTRLALEDYVSGEPPVQVVLFTHIEDNTPLADLDTPEALIQYTNVREGLIAFAKRVASYGLRWSLQPDWKFLLAALRFEGGLVSSETNGKPLLTWLRSDMGMPVDPHSHELQGYNYTDVAHLLDSLGVGGSTVIGGHIWDPALPQFSDWERFRSPLAGNRYPWASWRGDILMGAGTPGHVNDPVVSGVWRPADRWHYFDDDPAGNIASVGKYTGDMPGVEELVLMRRSGAVSADSILTASIHIQPSSLLRPADRLAAEDSILKPLAAMRNRGDVAVTDFTTLVNDWKTDFGGKPCVYRPGISTQVDEAHAAPSSAWLDVWPNPASTSVTVQWRMPYRGAARLALYDVLGNCVSVLYTPDMTPGEHHTSLRLPDVPPGVYHLRLESKETIAVRRIIVSP